MSITTTSPQMRARASFEAALREYHKRTGYDILSGSAASAAGLSSDDGPAAIHTALRSMLAGVRDSQDGRLDNALAKVLDALLLFTEISGEFADTLQAPGGKGIFVAFGLFLKTMKNYQDRKGELAALLTDVSDFLERFSVREHLDFDDTWNHELCTRIFINVLDVFALVTKILKGRISRVLRGVGAALLSNKDIRDASALLHRNIDAETRWTCVEVLAAVERVSLGVELANATLATTSAAMESQTVVLNSHTSELGAIRNDVQECLAFVHAFRTADRESWSSPVVRNVVSSTDLSIHRATSTDVDIYTVARDAMVVFGRLTSTQVTGEIRVPVACSVVLAMAMSPDIPILFRMMLANMMSFFMWHQVMMPMRVTLTVTVIVWPTRVQVPLSAMRSYESYKLAMREMFCDPDSREYRIFAADSTEPRQRLLHSYEWLFDDCPWELDPGTEIEVPLDSAPLQKVKPESDYVPCPYCGRHNASQTKWQSYDEMQCAGCSYVFIIKSSSKSIETIGGSPSYITQLERKITGLLGWTAEQYRPLLSHHNGTDRCANKY
ncbi:hypothetical protein CYLTODRAFT_417763 [Cylindrobasidium torrendii FP15055 ss-10]|uniref:Fungal STAND N-terminal Goodbye domain-containing protein n=1 Tax=Cylindrobasidium torrendii FP15055 ss-10 TaxID=1314674 RepID=A0A0D7BPR7_9AGAR|nr:hypothetical protein CYLTODRAFT_417763 [Cylindrobasidium torrendii FP15055 ss-10]